MTSPRLKRLGYRAWHRGTKELDLILGRFADRYLIKMSEAELSAFEALLDAADPELYDWIVKDTEPDAAVDAAMIARLRASLQGVASGEGT